MNGHHVRTATSGRQGIEQALAEPPDVALVDVGLPDIDGYEVGRTVRDQLGRGAVYLVARRSTLDPKDLIEVSH